MTLDHEQIIREADKIAEYKDLEGRSAPRVSDGCGEVPAEQSLDAGRGPAGRGNGQLLAGNLALLSGIRAATAHQGLPLRAALLWARPPLVFDHPAACAARATAPDFTHDAADALAYNFPVTGNGWDSGDLTTMAGGAGWHMSVDELLQVMATFRRGGTIVSPDQAQAMLDDGFGIDFSVATPLGTYYAKLGGWNDNAGHQEQGVAFYLPLNMELVVLVNSPVFEGPITDWLYPFVKAAYFAHITYVAPPVASASPA